MEDTYDFGGWATRNDLVCADGRIIRRNAFQVNDGQKVPLVWNHKHDNSENVLGHALLENRPEGVYAYGKFNDTESGQNAKKLVHNGDIDALSIWANDLKQNGANVTHGVIRELSLVLSGANPGAYIDQVSLAHGSDTETEAIIYTGEELETGDFMSHNSETDNVEKKEESAYGKEKTVQDVIDSMNEKQKTVFYAMVGSALAGDFEEEVDENISHSDEGGDSVETIQDVIETMNEDQKTVLYAMVGQVLEDTVEDKEDSENDGGNEMKHNVFENDAQETVLTHSDEMAILNFAKQSSCGSFQEALGAYLEDNESLAHSIDEIETLFPEFKDVYPGAPELISRDQTWVNGVISGVHKSPISRIRTRQADARQTGIRAKGYKKGHNKTEMGNIKLLKRTTDPQTVFVKDKLNRDDIIDITDFDVVNYMYALMRQTLEEELALAIMVGDGREEGDENKIDETHIRSIWHDDDLYTIHQDVDLAAARAELQGLDTGKNFGDNYVYAEAIIASALYAREQYKGTGNLTFYCTPHLLNVMLLARDLNGRRIYNSKADLAAALNVKDIETVEQFDGLTRTTTDSKTKKLLGIFVNLADYQVGSTKGGEITRFNQFDIDFNQEKYLIETRISGALTRVYSAICLEEDVTVGA